MATQGGRDRQEVRKQGEMRRKVVVLQQTVETERYPGGPTVMKSRTGLYPEAAGRQMAPRKLKN